MMVYSIILFVVAILTLAFGVSIYRGNTKLIHDYHQMNVKESERQEYGRAFANGMFVLCATLFISGIIALLGKEGPTFAVSLIALFAGLIVSVIVFVKVQKKYNGGLF